MLDPRTPVIVGVGQLSQRSVPAAARSPIDLLEDVARVAGDDAGYGLFKRVDTVAVVQIVSWPYPNAAAFVARRLGLEPRSTVMSTVGGNSPQLLLNEMGQRILEGRADVVLLGGAEAMHTRWRARREPRTHLDWETGDDEPCRDVIGDDRPGVSDYELAHGAAAPTLVYPLFETALRAAAGRDIATHQQAVSELWSTFAAVAADNPNAWSRTAYTPEQIRTVTPENRMVAFPYPKLMCSNIDVDQSAALLLCSYGTARAAGVADDRLVFLHAGADGHDHWFVTERDTLHDSPGIGTVVRDALDAAGVGIDDCARFDFYSCFPSAVQLAQRALNLKAPSEGGDRPLTVTGGLGFAGGPVNNYPTHAIARMVELLRADPGSFALTTALGWYATKHSAGIWSTTPPRERFVRVPHETTQARIDALPRRAVAGMLDGAMTIEATSVAVERDGTPSSAIVAGLTGDGRRGLATTRDTGVMTSMMSEAWEGRTIKTVNDGTVNTVSA
ncbi:MAG: acetyl-CoA acetyltransferase [Actinomycetia bacterium]|nr:acetyl-CoA acetyltransferase [Actinomycetes bacterium]